MHIFIIGWVVLFTGMVVAFQRNRGITEPDRRCNLARNTHSEYEILTTYHDTYEKDNQMYLELLAHLFDSWTILHNTVRDIIPDFDWK